MDENEEKREEIITKDNIVFIRNLFARYFENVDVLHNVNMTVSRGQVYILLGASGAGKSTLLKTLIGQVNGEAECFRILGEPQLENNYQIGYMPQVTGLIHDLTVRETWDCFGRFYSMKNYEIASRIDFLKEFLNLTSQIDQLCHTLSGGQKQRTSFGIALMSSPEILVLDEPMTGLDPVLRQKLWEHLKYLAKTYHTTVIMASQFFELACEADVVGIVHEGHLLVEENPVEFVKKWYDAGDEQDFLHSSASSSSGLHQNEIIPKLTQPNFDDKKLTSEDMGRAYDNLCQKYEFFKSKYEFQDDFVDYRSMLNSAVQHQTNNNNNNNNNNLVAQSSSSSSEPYLHQNDGEWQKRSKRQKTSDLKWYQIRRNVCESILKTHTRSYFRRLFPLILVLITPVIELLIYSVIMGHDVKRIDVGVCNQDGGNLSSYTIDIFKNRNEYNMFTVECGNSGSGPRNSVQNGDYLSSIWFKHSYSDALYEGKNNTKKNNMKLQLYLDTSAPVIASQISEDLYYSFRKTEEYIQSDSRDIREFVKPVAGSMDWRFSYYLSAGLVGMTPLVNGFVIALAEMTKREEDETHTRYRVAAITDMEFIVGNILGFGSLHWPQSMFLLSVFWMFFDYHMTISTFLILVVVVTGLVAVSLILSVTGGLLVKTQLDSILLMMTMFMPLMLLCGLFWPLESQPYMFRWISLLMPTTWGVSTFRAYLLKSEASGFPNFITHICLCSAWVIVFFNVALHLVKRKVKRIDAP